MRILFFVATLSACYQSSGEIFSESGDSIGSYECYASLSFDGSEVQIYSDAIDKDHVIFMKDDEIPLLSPFYRNNGEISKLLVPKSCDDISGGRVEML